MKLAFPSPDDLQVIDFDLITDELTRRAYHSTWVLHGVDRAGTNGTTTTRRRMNGRKARRLTWSV